MMLISSTLYNSKDTFEVSQEHMMPDPLFSSTCNQSSLGKENPS